MSIFGSTLGGIMGAVFGATGEIVPGTGTDAIDLTTAIGNAAVDRLLEQFKDRPNIVNFLQAVCTPLQVLSEAIQDLYSLRNVDTATGITLDGVGKIVGQPRLGLTDDDYRHYIKTRIARNRSKGTVEDIIRITRLALSDITPLRVQVNQQGTAGIVVRTLLSVLPAGRRDILIGFLRPSVKAGVRVILETLSSTEDDSFTFGLSQFLDEPSIPGDGSFSVGDTTKFPATGTLIVNQGMPDEETLNYIGSTPTSFTLATATTLSHAASSCVQLATGPGKGWGTTTNPAAGGVFVSAIG